MILVKVFPSGPFQTNAILLGCLETKKGAVIDPSFGSTQKILPVAREEKLQIEKILLTHSHWDHIADVFPLKKETGALVFVHAKDKENLLHPSSDKIPFSIPIQGVESDAFLEEGKIIHVGNLQIEVIHTPGHSPGSVVLYLKEHHLLFSGDTLFRGAIGNLQLPTGEPEKMAASLKKLALLPSQTRVIPGHGKETTIGAESWLSDCL